MKEKKEMSIDELTKEVSHLRSQIGGLRKANDMYRKKIKELEKLAKHNRAVDIEGDHLYEEKLAELEQTKKELEKTKKELGKCILKVEDKESDIEALQKKCSELLKTNKDLESRVAAFEELIDEAEETIAELRKPWWKRLF